MELRDEGSVSALYHLTLTEAEARALNVYLGWGASELTAAMEKVTGPQVNPYHRDMVRVLSDLRAILPQLLARADKAREAFKPSVALAAQRQDRQTEGDSND